MNIFFDTEFTGLNKDTTLISIGLIAENGDKFYAEFTDYDKSQIEYNDWIRENVINNLILDDDYKYDGTLISYSHKHIRIRDVKKNISKALRDWLLMFDEPIDMWSDCLAYDWVLFNDLLANYKNGYPELPKNINYIPFDICTLFKIKGIDPDISREEFVKDINIKNKHNSLYDAEIIKECYEKLINLN